MSRLRGVARNLSALFSSHVINAFQQVVLIPLFLHAYGAAGYGEWLALSAAVAYLGTLDFGVQTFVNQDLTVRYHRGDLRDFHVQQSTALRLLLGIVAAAMLLTLVAFALPLQHWLRLDGTGGSPVVPARTVQGAIYLLALQVLLTIPFGYLSGTFMVVDRAHIGAYWNNVKALAVILAGILTVSLHSNFMVVAAGQLLALVLSTLGVLVHLRRMAPQIFPNLRYWDRTLVGPILRPSSYFALIYSCTFLAFQMPLMILQREVGPVAVAGFSLMRTIFSMSRQVLAALTQALGPEITQQFARRDWKSLARIYDISERLIFATIPFVSVGVLAISPLLLRLWVHKPSLFALYPYCLTAALSMLMAAKEHKLQFQFSTNEHRDLARFMFGSYLALAVVSIPLIARFQVTGFLGAWLVVEAAQLAYTVRLNHRLFQHVETLTLAYMWRMLALGLGGVLLTGYVLQRWVQNGNPLLALAFSLLLSGAVLAISWPVFDLGRVLMQLKSRWQRKSAMPVVAAPEVVP